MDHQSGLCYRFFPCLSDPTRRTTFCMKLALVMIHLIYAGFISLVDDDLIENAKKEPRFTALYLLLFVATLVHYFAISISNPGYVLDVMRDVNKRNAVSTSTEKLETSNKNESIIILMDGQQTGKNVAGSNATYWSKLVADLYPVGSTIRTWTCTYCNVEQPPRAKHCHDCDKCVLQFDHHCVWLGNCIGQGNHCQFWWYLCEETAVCIWTGVLYILHLKAHITKVWWQDAITILLLITLFICLCFLLLLLLFHSYLMLTNQTTYELVRRKRIPYLRGIPESSHPFSKGVCRNVYNFCCAHGLLEALPTPHEIEEKSRPYPCSDLSISLLC